VLKRTDLEAETHAESLALADKDEQFMNVDVDTLLQWWAGKNFFLVPKIGFSSISCDLRVV